MAASPWVWPIAAMAALVFAVAVRMFFTRIPEMKRRGIHPQSVASARAMAERLEDSRAADHYRNLFEMPVLFHAACLAAIGTGVSSTLGLALAWGYVVLRTLMAIEACGRNKVMRRFQAFIASAVVLLLLWVVLVATWAGVL